MSKKQTQYGQPAIYNATAPSYTDGDMAGLQVDVNGNLKIVSGGNLGIRVTSDTQIKDGAGFLHSLSFAQSDAAPTAGSIIVYDSLTETGTILYSETFTTDVFRGYTVVLDIPFDTGLYVGFTTTADVGVTVSYR